MGGGARPTVGITRSTAPPCWPPPVPTPGSVRVLEDRQPATRHRFPWNGPADVSGGWSALSSISRVEHTGRRLHGAGRDVGVFRGSAVRPSPEVSEGCVPGRDTVPPAGRGRRGAITGGGAPRSRGPCRPKGEGEGRRSSGVLASTRVPGSMVSRETGAACAGRGHRSDRGFGETIRGDRSGPGPDARLHRFHRPALQEQRSHRFISREPPVDRRPVSMRGSRASFPVKPRPIPHHRRWPSRRLGLLRRPLSPPARHPHSSCRHDTHDSRARGSDAPSAGASGRSCRTAGPGWRTHSIWQAKVSRGAG